MLPRGRRTVWGGAGRKGVSKSADSTSGEPPAYRGRRPLPAVRLRGQLDMAVMLATHNRLLREQARHYLGRRANDEAVEASVERTVQKLLAMEAPSTPDGVGHAADVLCAECRRTVPP